ncbi:MAG: basic amino acid ABC transporter substrate-binding protein [Fusobacteriaceae bacterium]|jgi:polar amino acid transport system substrate-binding protein|nr:basic amino acid ABC transporter substrate-binding protein [Fusobacteriaceae bacterium]
MKKILLKLLLIFTFMFSALSFGAEKLFVGTNAEFEPFEYLKDGAIVGFDMDLINEISKIIGKECEIKNIAFDGLLPALQSKKLDIIIAGMTATDERKKFVNFSDTYYLAQQMIVLNSDAKTNIKTFDDLPGKSVGVILGYTGDVAVSEIKGVNVTRFNGTGAAIMALKSQKVDAVVLDSEPATQYASQNKELVVIETDAAKEEYAIAFRKEDTQLLEEVNKALKILKENGKYQELLKKYNLIKE